MSLHDPSGINRRLQRLETEAWRLRIAAAVLAALLTLGLAAPSPDVQEAVRARRIELVDETGVVRGVLEVNESGRAVARLSGPTESTLSLFPSMIEVSDGPRSAAVTPGEFQAYQRGVGAALLQSTESGPLLTLVNSDLEPELFAGRFPVAPGENTEAIFGTFRGSSVNWTSPR